MLLFALLVAASLHAEVSSEASGQTTNSSHDAADQSTEGSQKLFALMRAAGRHLADQSGDDVDTDLTNVFDVDDVGDDTDVGIVDYSDENSDQPRRRFLKRLRQQNNLVRQKRQHPQLGLNLLRQQQQQQQQQPHQQQQQQQQQHQQQQRMQRQKRLLQSAQQNYPNQKQPYGNDDIILLDAFQLNAPGLERPQQNEAISSDQDEPGPGAKEEPADLAALYESQSPPPHNNNNNNNNNNNKRPPRHYQPHVSQLPPSSAFFKPSLPDPYLNTLEGQPPHVAVTRPEADHYHLHGQPPHAFAPVVKDYDIVVGTPKPDLQPLQQQHYPAPKQYVSQHELDSNLLFQVEGNYQADPPPVYKVQEPHPDEYGGDYGPAVAAPVQQYVPAPVVASPYEQYGHGLAVGPDAPPAIVAPVSSSSLPLAHYGNHGYVLDHFIRNDNARGLKFGYALGVNHGSGFSYQKSSKYDNYGYH